MPFDPAPAKDDSRAMTGTAMVGVCLGGVLIAVLVAVLLYGFVRYVAA
jgi:hypothetical protein